MAKINTTVLITKNVSVIVIFLCKITDSLKTFSIFCYYILVNDKVFNS